MKTSSVIYNCKRCKVGRRAEYPLHDRFGSYRLSADGRRIDPGVYVRTCGGGMPTVYGGDTEMGLCPTCRRAMKHGKLINAGFERMGIDRFTRCGDDVWEMVVALENAAEGWQYTRPPRHLVDRWAAY